MAAPGKATYWLNAISLLVLLLLVLAMFADVLFVPGEKVLSKPGTDLFSQFVHWRAFGFGELRKGNLPLWNPHIFSGAPYFGGFQSALLYPPNWVYMILPLAKAINWGIAFHVFLAGAFMFAWARYRGIHTLGSLLSAVLLMFCGAHFPHVYAGHLPNLCAMVWAPLIFLAIDGLLQEEETLSKKSYFRDAAGWVLLGTFAVAMQILAGHPQYVFYTGIAACIYILCRVVRATKRIVAVAGFVTVFVWAALLGAVQLLTGLDAASETVRSGGVSYEFAAMFSLPPENLITLMAPGFFGNMNEVAYWGRCYLWEMTLFIGVAGFILAVYGAVRGEKKVRLHSIAMVVILFVLALGSHTPLFKLLYRVVPGFDTFRGNSKFIYPMSLFLIMLAGAGMDRIIRNDRVSFKPGIVVLITGVIVGGVAIAIWGGASTLPAGGWWSDLMHSIHQTNESYLPRRVYEDPAFVKRACAYAAGSLGIGALTVFAVAGLFFWRRYSRHAAFAFLILGVLEVILFARTFRPTFELSAAQPRDLKAFADSHSGDYRILNLADPDAAMSFNTFDIWGYDPGVLRRYSEFVSFTQDKDPNRANQYVRFHKIHRPFQMLRCRFAFVPDKGELKVTEFKDPMPRLVLVSRYRVLAGRDEIFAAVTDPAFDPRAEVILEHEPEPRPVPIGRPGTVRLIDFSTDHLEIEADVPAPALLLVTDSYSKGWRAKPFEDSTQKSYSVMPANYILRAIPLEAGQHHLRLEYCPTAFRIGKRISIAALVCFLAFLVYFVVFCSSFCSWAHRFSTTLL